jgi:hypothetical protein
MAKNAIREDAVNKSGTFAAASRAIRNAFIAVRVKSSSDAPLFFVTAFNLPDSVRTPAAPDASTGLFLAASTFRAMTINPPYHFESTASKFLRQSNPQL